MFFLRQSSRTRKTTTSSVQQRLLQFARRISTIQLTGWTIWLLDKLYDRTALDRTLSELRLFDRGTVGREIAEMLDSRGYRLIPKFENHDLKHIVLDFDMTMQDEIKMQAYLVGNGNFTFPCLLFLSLGIFYPAIWKDLVVEYKLGKCRNSIHFLTLDYCKHKTLDDIKKEYGRLYRSNS